MIWPFKRKPRTFFVSDLHFGHKNVIQYCNRPWQDIETMHAAMIEIWNKTVRPQDSVYILGDFSLNPKWVDKIVPQLNGWKMLVSGNHDVTFVKRGSIRRYENAGFHGVLQNQVILNLKNGVRVLMCHFPYDTEYDERYKEFRPKDQGMVLLHGHLHSKYRKNGRQIDVGFDGDLKLWSEDEIIKLIEDKRDFIPTPITEYYKSRNMDKRVGLSSNNNV